MWVVEPPRKQAPVGGEGNWGGVQPTGMVLVVHGWLGGAIACGGLVIWSIIGTRGWHIVGRGVAVVVVVRLCGAG